MSFRSSVSTLAHAALAALVAGLFLAPPAASASVARPRIDAVFVLDTTGSMSGLLEGAKRKIWSIADRIASAKGEPEVRLGLVAYRDRGDQYVTRVFDLSDDVDTLYGQLRALQADGGGDGPESVNRALDDAIERMSWRDDASVYRVVFLVGDAPPHMDYQGEVQYPATTARANQRGIVINTVQCGEDPSTRQIWQEIARSAEGEYVAIAADGGMVAMATPYDEELSVLQGRLAETALPYGSDEERTLVAAKVARSVAAPPTEAAARLSYLSKSKAGIASGGGDLVDAIGNGLVEIEDLPATALPEPMRALDPEAREQYVAERKEARDALDREIGALVDKRERFIAEETKRRRADGAADGFDERVLDAIRRQAADKGIAYPEAP